MELICQIFQRWWECILLTFCFGIMLLLNTKYCYIWQNKLNRLKKSLFVYNHFWPSILYIFKGENTDWLIKYSDPFLLRVMFICKCSYEGLYTSKPTILEVTKSHFYSWSINTKKIYILTSISPQIQPKVFV